MEKWKRKRLEWKKVASEISRKAREWLNKEGNRGRIMDNLKWEKLDEKKYSFKYRGYLIKSFRLPDGRVEDFYIKDEPDSICILPITKDNKILIAKQFRPGPEEILFELPGGGRNKEESLLEAAERELLEETGYTGNLQFIGQSIACGYSNMIRYNFIAINCYKKQEKQEDKNEFIEVIEVSLKKFMEYIEGGKLSDTQTALLGLYKIGILRIEDNDEKRKSALEKEKQSIITTEYKLSKEEKKKLSTGVKIIPNVYIQNALEKNKKNV